MIRVQLYTGMRPGELCQMRAMDIEVAGEPRSGASARSSTPTRSRRSGCALLGTTGALGPPTTLLLACVLHWDDRLGLAQGCLRWSGPTSWRRSAGDAIEMNLKALSAAARRLRTRSGAPDRAERIERRTAGERL
jgi:hypothetical protein